VPKRDAVPGLGEKLKAVRTTAGVTQVAAAEASGVSRVNISSFESDAKTPTLATLYKLAAAYGVNVCDLLPGGLYEGKPVLPAPESKKPKKK
jgi:transcriptional regulator with XRE-family HTH domain